MESAALVRLVLDTAVELRNVTVRVRQHPSEDRTEVRALLVERGLEDIYADGSLSDEMHQADLVVAQYSTTVMEAMLAEVPVVLAALQPHSWALLT